MGDAPAMSGPVFSVPTFLGVGDDFDKRRVTDQRSMGRNFVTNPGKKGLGPDATLDHEFRSIHAGDPYIDPGTMDRRYRREKAAKRIVAEGFRYPNPPRKSTGPGDYFGTIDGKAIPHETDYAVPRKGDPIEKREIAKRPMYTNPTKKGTYGVVGTLLSTAGTEHVADPEVFKVDARRRAIADDRARMKGEPWRLSGVGGKAFDEGPASGASKVYTMTKPMAPRKPPAQDTKPKGPDTAWRPSGVIPSGKPHLEYREDPYGGYDPRVPPQKKKPDERARWKPSGQPTSWYTKSIAFARL